MKLLLFIKRRYAVAKRELSSKQHLLWMKLPRLLKRQLFLKMTKLKLLFTKKLLSLNKLIVMNHSPLLILPLHLELR